MRGPPEGLQRTCGSSFVRVAWRKLYRALAHGWNGTSATLRLVGWLVWGLSKPRPPGFRAMVAPALPLHIPFSPGSGPRLTRPSGQCGVGRDGCLALPRPPPPLPPGAAFVGSAGACAGEGRTVRDNTATPAAAISARLAIIRCCIFGLLTERSNLWNYALARSRAQPLAGGSQRHRSRVQLLRAVFGERAVDDDFIADLHGVLGPAAAQQGGGRSHFASPVEHLAGIVRDIDVEEHVGVHPIDFGDDPFVLHRFGWIVFRGERMVRQQRGSRHEHTDA